MSTAPSPAALDVGGSGSSLATEPQSKMAAEEARKNSTLAAFMLMLDDFEPLVVLKRVEHFVTRLTCWLDRYLTKSLITIFSVLDLNAKMLDCKTCSPHVTFTECL